MAGAVPRLQGLRLEEREAMAAWAHVAGAQVGFLHKAKVLDFAGGNVVHVAAGFSGLMCSIVVGKVCLHRVPTPSPAALATPGLGKR
jgi:ammonia channel protein AmtB